MGGPGAVSPVTSHTNTSRGRNVPSFLTTTASKTQRKPKEITRTANFTISSPSTKSEVSYLSSFKSYSCGQRKTKLCHLCYALLLQFQFNRMSMNINKLSNLMIFYT